MPHGITGNVLLSTLLWSIEQNTPPTVEEIEQHLMDTAKENKNENKSS